MVQMLHVASHCLGNKGSMESLARVITMETSGEKVTMETSYLRVGRTGGQGLGLRGRHNHPVLGMGDPLET